MFGTLGMMGCLFLAVDNAGAEERTRGGWMGWVKRVATRQADQPEKVRSGSADLEMRLSLEPARIRLGVDRRIRVRVELRNRGKRMCELEFSSTQRIEVRLLEGRRGVLETWSEDRRFERNQGWVALNPGERLEYEAEVSARDMEPEGTYVVEAWIADHPELRTRVALRGMDEGSARDVPDSVF
jgi:hypothetical protein